jgi:formylglycine-generating enzyme required for sulfatase activity
VNTVSGFSNPWFTRGDSASGATADYTVTAATGDVAWYVSNSGSQTAEVAQKTANSLGLYDMSGNVAEWCFDWADEAVTRVVRGGSFGGTASLLRIGHANDDSPASKEAYIGFRFARNSP